jgi:ribosome-associated protein
MPDYVQPMEYIMAEFKLEGREYIELNDLLKVTGLFDSGGMAKTAISEGRVTVDGKPELRRRCKIRTGHVVGFEGHRITVT